MKTLSIRYVSRPREPFGDYHYDILRGGTLVARFSHDYRGEECHVLFPGGRKEDVGPGAASFLAGGGPEPLRLSEAALRFLAERLPPEE